MSPTVLAFENRTLWPKELKLLPVELGKIRKRYYMKKTTNTKHKKRPEHFLVFSRHTDIEKLYQAKRVGNFYLAKPEMGEELISAVRAKNLIKKGYATFVTIG